MNSDTFPDRLYEAYTGYDPETETYHERHDWESDRSLTTTVVETLTAVTNDEPTDIEPVYEVIDPDLLERVFRPLHDADELSAGVVQFTYDGRAITISSDGKVCIDCGNIDERSRD